MDRFKKRNNYPHIEKLIDITGESEKFEGNKVPNAIWYQTVRGDNFSAWYHFAGTALRTFLTANSPHTHRLVNSVMFMGIGSAEKASILKSISPALAKLYTQSLVILEEYVMWNQFIDPQKRRNIDFAGIDFGARLARNLADDKFQKKKECSDSRQYLYDAPSIYGPAWALSPSQKPWQWTGTFTEQEKAEDSQTLEKTPSTNQNVPQSAH